jgi:hypothetical protein
MPTHTFADTDLVDAVAQNRSWRAVLRQLGLEDTSAAARRSVRRRADELALDYSHFTGQRRWSEGDLAAAIASSRTWAQVRTALGLSGGASATALKGHATRLGLDFSHFNAAVPPREVPVLSIDQGQLPRAGGLIAAAFFTLCGYEVSWPLEPCRYDLVAAQGRRMLRVQVKTTRYESQGSWRVSLSTGGRNRETYDPEDIDYFFVIDADFQFYLIPVASVAGLSTIHLSAYARFRVAQPLPQPT